MSDKLHLGMSYSAGGKEANVMIQVPYIWKGKRKFSHPDVRLLQRVTSTVCNEVMGKQLNL